MCTFYEESGAGFCQLLYNFQAKRRCCLSPEQCKLNVNYCKVSVKLTLMALSIIIYYFLAAGLSSLETRASVVLSNLRSVRDKAVEGKGKKEKN